MRDGNGESARREQWGAADVRRLRDYLGESQAALAARLGTRQQTVSEWETGASQPRRMSRRLLRLVAEESGYYATDTGGGPAEGAALPSSPPPSPPSPPPSPPPPSTPGGAP